LPSQTDDSDYPSTLPRPELNPLMNPILGRNMGRWAEVYFTSPPEKREQAVMELLLELQARESRQDHSLPSDDLEPAAPEGLSPSAEEGPSSREWPSEWAAPSRYRVYVGLILAVALLILAYVAWRGSRAESGKSLPAPVPRAETRQSAAPTATPAQPSGTTKTNAPHQSSPVSSQQVVPLQSGATISREPNRKSGPEEPAGAAAPATTPTTTSPGVGAPATHGAQELSIAKSYLNGGDGKPRDSALAIQWLWKAVAKQNAEATELLSDLYLKGEGVPKNCDQARILLDAAARKGVQPAAERLQHLQDFGCQ